MKNYINITISKFAKLIFPSPREQWKQEKKRKALPIMPKNRKLKTKISDWFYLKEYRVKRRTPMQWVEHQFLVAFKLVIMLSLMSAIYWFGGKPTYTAVSPIPKGSVLGASVDTVNLSAKKYEHKIVDVIYRNKEIVVAGRSPTEIIYDYFGSDAKDALKCITGDGGVGENAKLSNKARNYNTNGSIDSGVMQINSIHKTKYGFTDNEEFAKWLENPENNIRVGYDIYKNRGWAAWYGCKNMW